MNWKEELEAALKETFSDEYRIGSDDIDIVPALKDAYEKGFERAKGWLLSNLPDVFYVPVEIKSDEDLPKDSWRGFVWTKKSDGVTMEKKATYWKNREGWVVDDNWQDEVVTHWIKKVSLLDIKQIEK